MISVSLRLAKPTDLDQIQDVGIMADARFLQTGHPELADGTTISVEAATKAMAEDRLTVAEVANKVVGWMYVTRLGNEMCLGQISVLPAFGDQGIGSALLKRVTGDAKRKGETSIVLSTQIDVLWNAPWYQRRHYEIVPREQWSKALTELAEQQSASGLDWTTRVFMRLKITP